MNFGSKKIPGLAYVIAVVYLFYCVMFTPNFLLTIPVVIFPLLIFKLFWIDKETNVVFWGMMLQWTLPATQLIYCNFLGITPTEKWEGEPIYSKGMDTAIRLNILGLFAFATGLFLAIRNLKFHKVQRAIDHYPPKRVLTLYIIFTLTMIFTGNVIWLFPSIVQFIFIFFYLKWGLFLVTFYVIHKRAPLLRWNFYGFVFFEFVLGLSSFFAGQIVFIILFSGAAIVHLQPRVTLRTGIFVSIGLVILIHYLILWTAIKTEYRTFVSQGRVTQSVQVSSEAARDKLLDLMGKVDTKKYQRGLEAFVNRVGYIQYFAAAVDYVPKVVPHQDGEVYLSAVQHYLIPRFLNPDKENLDDTKHTSKFTGIRLSGRKEGTSFSLGYITDAYVDFGPYWMNLLLIVIGYLFGFCYRFLLVRCPNDFWMWIITGPFIILLNINGADTKKALGGLILYFVTVLIVRKQLIRIVESSLRPPKI